MPMLHCIALPRLQRPLLDKFYRVHGSPMRAAREGQPWVARQDEIVGALNLTPVAGGYWLTGLFVAPALRGQSIAATLVQQSLAQSPGPAWLFCHPELLPFYQRLGFMACQRLPEALAHRLARYTRGKPLVALSHSVPAYCSS